jgi:hypothetical protein
MPVDSRIERLRKTPKGSEMNKSDELTHKTHKLLIAQWLEQSVNFFK